MKVISNQTLFDIAVQEDGNILALFEWALANGLSPTATLAAGMELVAVESVYRDIEIAEYFRGRQQKIATGLTSEQEELLTTPLGIGFMNIEGTFIVS